MSRNYQIKFTASPIQELIRTFNCVSVSEFNAGRSFESYISYNKLKEVNIVEFNVLDEGDMIIHHCFKRQNDWEVSFEVKGQWKPQNIRLSELAGLDLALNNYK